MNYILKTIINFNGETMKKTNLLIALLFALFFIYTLINIKSTNTSTMNTLIIFSKTILPALLPFLILNQLLIKLGIIDLIAYFLQFISYPLFKISGKGASIIIIGLLNGFPSSVIFTSIMFKEKQINKEESQRLINYIFFPSISFLFNIIQSNLNNKYLFTYLILSLYLTGFLFLYISSFKVKENTSLLSFKETINCIKEKLTKVVFIKDLKDTINYAFNTLVNILGIIVIFQIPCQIINSITNSNNSYIFKGLIEFSMPSIQLSSSTLNKKRIVLLLGTILSFSSLSSIMQAVLFINEATLDSKKFIINRLIICISTYAILLTFLFFLL